MSELRQIQIELSEHEALLLLKLVKYQMMCQQGNYSQNDWGCWRQLADKLQASIETTYYSRWLTPAGQVLLAGCLPPRWVLLKPLSGLKEQDQTGHCLISNEGLGLYGVGFTQEQALADFETSLINNYRFLEENSGGNPDLQPLFQKYQSYLRVRE